MSTTTYYSTQLMPAKDPSEVLDYTIDWYDTTLAEGPLFVSGETISGTPVWTVPSGITKDSQTNDTTTSTIWLSVGTAGTEYSITCKVVTSASRTFERTIIVPVKNR